MCKHGTVPFFGDKMPVGHSDLKVLEVIAFLILLLLITIPHIALNYLFGYGAFVNEILHFITLFLLALVVMATLLYSNGSLTTFDILILYFAVLNQLNSNDWLQPNETSSVILVSVLGYFAFSWLVGQVGEKYSFKCLAIGILIAVMIQIVFVTLQVLGILPNPNHLFNVGGSFGHPGYSLGVLSLGTLIVISNFAFYKQDRYLRIAIIVSLIILMIFSVAMGARASIIVSLLSLFVLLNRYRPDFKGLVRRYKIAFFILSISVGFALFLLKPDSLRGRYLIWKNSVQLIVQKPLLGFGSDSFIHTYNAYQIDYFKNGYGSEQEKELSDFVTLAYNDFIETGIEQGLQGMVLLLLIFVIYPLSLARKQGDYISLVPFLGIFIFMNTWGILHEPVYSSLIFIFLAFVRKKMP